MNGPYFTFLMQLYFKARMYSSRMRTARLLTISQHALSRGVSAWEGGGLPRGVSAWGGVCLPRGVSSQRVSAQGMSAQEGCLPKGGVCPGVCLPGGVYPSMEWGRHPPVDRQTGVKT